MNDLNFESLAEFLAGTKDKTRDEVRLLAEEDYSILSDWIDSFGDVPSKRATRESPQLVDYFADLKILFGGLDGYPPDMLWRHRTVIESALKQWDQNAKQG